MFGLGITELLLIMAILIIVFGAGKLSGVGAALGKSIREFRQATEEPIAAAQVRDVEAPR